MNSDKPNTDPKKCICGKPLNADGTIELHKDQVWNEEYNLLLRICGLTAALVGGDSSVVPYLYQALAEYAELAKKLNKLDGIGGVHYSMEQMTEFLKTGQIEDKPNNDFLGRMENPN